MAAYKMTIAALTVAAVFFSGVSANAQSSTEVPPLQLEPGFVPRSVFVRAEGEHDVRSSAVLRERGCEGYVSTDPDLFIRYNDRDTGGSLVIRAESGTDLVMLIGSGANSWYCNDDAVGTNPEIVLPAGSGSYSVWVGTFSPGEARATVSIREIPGDEPLVYSGRCGEPRARIPDSIAVDDWAQFSCMTGEQAGSRLEQCYPRTAYSDLSGDGCPGAELCCPPIGFDLAASQQRAQQSSEETRPSAAEAAAAAESAVSEESATEAPPEERSTESTTGAASEPEPPSLQREPQRETLETTPWAHVADWVEVHWLGFSDARLNVYTEPSYDAAVAFRLPAASLPIRVESDARLVATESRRLRARRAVRLESGDDTVTVQADSVIELLGAYRDGTCELLVRDDRLRATCPRGEDFAGVDGPFLGLSPLAWEWWIPVFSTSGDQGWLPVDSRRPELHIVLP